MRAKHAALGAVCGVALGLLAEPAQAYCVSTTCEADLSDASCELVRGCWVGGQQLRWPNRCISFSVQEDGSPLRGIAASAATRAISKAFATWMGADCGAGEGPSIAVFSLGEVSCRRQEYSQSGGNANAWIFRDDAWPYPDDSGTLALTTVTYNPDTGEIFDADVEVNTADNSITVGDSSVSFDFASIATHEAGHVLGLSHTLDRTATMYAEYSPRSVATRSLTADDETAICEAIPPDRPLPADCNPEPRRGFSSECADRDSGGCAATLASRAGASTALVGCVVLSGLVAWRRRARRRARQHAAARSLQ
jgi:hypothetical protein